ncbi:velvet factor-domain-containing protein [Fomitopsis serialis]|uniref:velvet factor-domain-containing protein n=1 Tax=Fomitopsis serialis TaxID=139415 RepID=UPI002007B108|nr:velvet factor-domain-containing protein [Neoantrodia serialis]KAH9931954.1 velvet factor-domain-containing protein [Neoantrodia serialis]
MSVQDRRTNPGIQRGLARTTPTLIGQPVLFTAGPYAGRVIRADLVELQKADLGRKCGIRDRRPVDPPPVLRLRLYEVSDVDTAAQREEELVHLSEVDTHGFICHVDLFPNPMPTSTLQTTALVVTEQAGSSTASAAYYTQHEQHLTSTTEPSPRLSAACPVANTASSLSDGGQQPELHHGGPGERTRRTRPGSYASDGLPGQVATYVNGVPVLESSRCTQLIAGTLFSASSCIEYQRAAQLMFIFSDLAVREDGDYFLRYRTFNTLYSAAGSSPIPILAECYGGPFKVYSTKDFPGLRASTELTKHISHYGVASTRACPSASGARVRMWRTGRGTTKERYSLHRLRRTVTCRAVLYQRCSAALGSWLSAGLREYLLIIEFEA